MRDKNIKCTIMYVRNGLNVWSKVAIYLNKATKEKKRVNVPVTAFERVNGHNKWQ